LDPARFTDEAFRGECSATIADQRALWARKARAFFPVPSQQDLANIADDPTWDAHVLDVCRKALAGEYPFFSHWSGRLGWPPNFNLDPIHGIDWPVGQHWLGTARSGPPRHDIKFVWEPSRFSLAYTFARAYARSKDEKWAEAFWQMFDAWIEQNPPQLTVAWGCGQEISFRLMAMLFAAIVTLESPAATGERLHALSRLAWQSGRQVHANINYARSQKNNHALSEAMGLWTIGLLFPEFRQAERWQDHGRDVLATETHRQIYDDGSYVQHSMNYHRVMLDVLLWAIRLGQINETPLPQTVSDRVAHAADWLAEMLDPDSGRVPNYGANDGANVLPLSCCDYLDYRPTVQAAQYLVNERHIIEAGPWDEKLLWLAGPKAVGTVPEPPSCQPHWSAADGGYYILRGPNSWTMTRCHTYRDRPSQADMLHVDLWYKGVNVLRDAGSYMYYCDEPDKSYFNSTAAHNTVTADGQSQMLKGPRFLWFCWPRARVVSSAVSEDWRIGYIRAEHFGYVRGGRDLVHRRTVCRIDDAYVVVDDLIGTGRHAVALLWRLCSADWQQQQQSWSANVGPGVLTVAIHSGEGLTVEMRGSTDTDRSTAYESLYYGKKRPTPSLVASGNISAPLRVVSLVQPQTEDEAGVSVASFEAGNPNAPLRLAGVDTELAATLHATTSDEILT